MNTKVSIGIPTFNRPFGLRRTLECISNQTYKNLEIIISDNNSSSPDTEMVAREFMAKNDRIYYYKQSVNQGPAFNFSFVLENATGAYFMWAPDDDLWEPEFVEKLLANFNKFPLAVSSFCNIKEINEDNIVTDEFRYSNFLSHTSIFKRLNYFGSLKEGSFGKANLIYAIHRTEVIKDIFLKFDYNYYCADNIIILKLLCRGPVLIATDFLYSVGSYNEKHYDPAFNTVTVTAKEKTYSELVFSYTLKRRKYFSKYSSIVKNNVHGTQNRLILTLVNYKKELLFVADDLIKLGRNGWYNIKGHGFAFLKLVVRMTKKVSI
jgi:glycosyltransferase involved in cell wall biosynthesis